VAALVSIIIPCYNAAPWVAEAIQSGLNQTYKPIEIIVVDDGSRDDSLAVVSRFESRILKVISQDNRGNGAARNRAIEEAQGDYIQYLDADDLLAPDKIEMQTRRLTRAQSECVAAGAWARFCHCSFEAEFRAERLWRDFLPIDWLVMAWGERLMMASHAWLVPRGIVDKAGPWDENLRCNVDGEYFTRVVLQSRQILFCPEARVYYRSGIPGSVSRKADSLAVDSVLRSYELCAENLLKAECSPRTREAAAALFQGFIYDTYPEAGELIRMAETRIASLGGSRLALKESVVFNSIACLIGWKLARRLQEQFRKIRYGK
jgi:glycosyltransferase involved in cell wall biosynthesis